MSVNEDDLEPTLDDLLDWLDKRLEEVIGQLDKAEFMGDELYEH